MQKRHLILIFVVLLISLGIAGRLYLPYWLAGYVNKTLDDIEGHTGSIDGIEVNLYRGAYRIKGLSIEKEKGKVKVPFLTAESADISIQWRSLLHGSVVAEVDFLRPVINFVGAAQSGNRQTGEGTDWTQPLKELLPVRINRLTVADGTVVYHDFDSNPRVDIDLQQLELVLTNISNVENTGKPMPSSLTASAVSVGNGRLKVVAQLNLLRKIPDVDLNLKFEKVNLPALNDFLRAYVNVQAISGTFFLYSEVVVQDGKLRGYVKPLLVKVDLADVGDGQGNILENIWGTIVGTVMEIFKNQPRDQVATRVPLEGDLNNPDAAILPTIWNIFRNAFVQGFSKNIDGSVKFMPQKDG